MSEARQTIRHAGLLLVQRGIYVVVGLLFAALVPRLMGPELYGRYVLLSALSIWFVGFSLLGFTEVIGRYVPKPSLEDDGEGLRKLFGNLLMVRLASGAAAAGCYLLVTAVWLRDFDVVILAIMAVAVCVRSVAYLPFVLFLGLNQAARWGFGELLRSVLLLFLIPGFYLAGLRGACLGLFLAELTTLCVGVWWSRGYLSWSALRVDRRYLAPYIQFGLIFFGGNLLAMAFQGSGEAVVRAVSGDYVQVGYFGLAHGVYLTAATAMGALNMAFAPLLTTLRDRRDTELLRQWIKRVMTWQATGGVMVVFGVLILGDGLVPVLLGAAYQPVAVNLVPLAVTLILLSVTTVGGVLVLTHDRPGVALRAAAIRLLAFWSLAPAFVAWWASLGACMAVLAASAVHAAYLTWSMRVVLRDALGSWALTTGLGALFVPLVLLRSSWPVNVMLYVVFLVGYGTALGLTRVIAPAEVTAAWQIISSGGGMVGSRRETRMP